MLIIWTFIIIGNTSSATRNSGVQDSISSEDEIVPLSTIMDVDPDEDEHFDGPLSDGSDCCDVGDLDAIEDPSFVGSLSDGSDCSGIDEMPNDGDFRGQAGSLTNDLRKWSFEFNIRNQATSALLKILRTHCGDAAFDLPTDARTLLKTASDPVQIEEIAGGQYWHNGLQKCLKMYFK